MSAIILDAELRARLNGLNQQLEVRDEMGVVVGHFLPAREYLALLYELELSRPVDPAELERARQEVHAGRGMTTAEAIAYLENKAGEGRRP